MKSLPFALIMAFSFFSLLADAQTCDSTLWKYVYHSRRLKALKDCVVATGIIKSKSKKPDGDWHIELQLDSGQDSLLNKKNKSGVLTIEVICANTSWQPGTVKKCKRCSSCRKLTVPPDGVHVKVTGSWVKDKWHGWNEIHPVSAIEIIAQ